MSDIMTLFKTIILVQLFYAVAITGLVATIPDDAKSYVTGFSDIADSIDVDTVSEDVQDSLQRQQSIPVIELGALVFYSGNILIDLLLNFFFAIPQMLTMLVNGLMLLFTGVNVQAMGIIQLFLSVITVVMYVISIIQLTVGVRSGRLV